MSDEAGTQEQSAKKSHPGEPVIFRSEDKTGFLLDLPRAENAFSTDQFGTWLSANAPIRDPAITSRKRPRTKEVD